MKLSCYTNCYGADGVWSAVEHARIAGLSWIELALRTHAMGGLAIPESAVITEKAEPETVERFRALLAKNAVGLSGCNIGGADPLTAEGEKVLKQRISRAVDWFGATLVVSGAGQPASQAERSRLIERLRAIGDHAEGLGVCIALETHKGPTQNAQEMRKLMDELDHPAVRLNFDTGNIAYYNLGLDAASELEKVVGFVANVHVKDNRGRYEDWYFPAVGDGGSVDFRRIRHILLEAGYQGACTIEIEGISGEQDVGPEGRRERVLRSVEYLRQCGFKE